METKKSSLPWISFYPITDKLITVKVQNKKFILDNVKFKKRKKSKKSKNKSRI